MIGGEAAHGGCGERRPFVEAADVFAPQCVATLAVVRRETNSWRWPIIMFAYMLGLAYGAAFIVYQTAVALGAG